MAGRLRIPLGRKLSKQGFTPTDAWNRLAEFRDLLPLIPPTDDERGRNGIENSSNVSISAGTTCATRACRLLTDRVDIRIIRLMLGHASTQ